MCLEVCLEPHFSYWFGWEGRAELYSIGGENEQVFFNLCMADKIRKVLLCLLWKCMVVGSFVCPARAKELCYVSELLWCKVFLSSSHKC